MSFNVDALAAREEIQTFKDTTVRAFHFVSLGSGEVGNLIYIDSFNACPRTNKAKAKFVGGALEALGNSIKNQNVEQQQSSIDAANMLLESAAASSANAAQDDAEIAEILKVAEEAAALTGMEENDDGDDPAEDDDDEPAQVED